VAKQDAQLARDVVLALVVQEPRHGWAIHDELAPTGQIGRAWTLSRQLVYRAIDTLEADGFVKRAKPKDGGGGDKVIISPTAKGKAHAQQWLEEPVAHLRDVRTELVVKIMLRERAGLSLLKFIEIQRETFIPLIQAIENSPADTPVDMWRRESASAVKRYLTRLEKSL
jgi:PadR family transcriptional regulator AphA